ncbi:hypothetical protein F7725_009455 [Dissostichus mawsoni]|uniref:Uncharacterized protein n=1 Tax=Dissostichus mawsoni TaxID=36200 RepID=A0A7J5XM72_DISMA|nr:hypothetical protein F7725_009455 [Dissostichus mawsoni]
MLQLDEWTCKLCRFSSYKEKAIVNHYKEKHGRGRWGFCCIYPNCLTVPQSHPDKILFSGELHPFYYGCKQSFTYHSQQFKKLWMIYLILVNLLDN